MYQNIDDMLAPNPIAADKPIEQQSCYGDRAAA
jgi:hypothetical protein